MARAAERTASGKPSVGPRAQSSKNVVSQSRQRLAALAREAIFFLAAACSVFLLAALITYSPTDPGWARAGDGSGVANLAGAPGAWFADVLLRLFGYIGFVVPLVVFYGGWVIGVRGGFNETDIVTATVRPTALALAVLALCGLVWLCIGSGALWLPYSSGGLAGLAIAQPLVGIFKWVGASWLLATACVIALSIGFNISWLAATEAIGGVVTDVALRAARFIGPHARHVGGLLLERGRALRAAHADKKRAKRKDAEAKRGTQSAPVFDNAADTTPPYAKSEKLADEQGVVPVPESTPYIAPEPDIPPEPATPADTASSHAATSEKSASASGQAQRAETSAPSRPTPPPAVDDQLDLSIEDDSDVEMPRFEAGVDSPLPPTTLLDAPPPAEGQDDETLQQYAHALEQHLADFRVKATVTAVQPGPVVTRFELQPAAGVKVSQVSNLAKDLARAMSVRSVRVVEVIPGRSVIGLEIPNPNRETVALRALLDSQTYIDAESALTLALGKDIAGNAVTADLSKMPHLLAAGTTGSGKSVAVNAMILSILHKAGPEQVRMILIDPKMLELSVYEKIPHLLAPVVTDMKDAANALRWCVGEMERRYKLMAALGVRNIAGFNAKVRKANAAGKPIEDPLLKQGQPDAEAAAGETVPTLEPMPSIVVVVDELADMMMVVGKKVEELIARLAQKARAAGLHMILATQRPSVDVITGLIKANIPTRIGFQVASKIDSRTILDQQGAESLLGHGDMLYLPPGSGFSDRVHGAFVDDHEVHRVVEYLKQTGDPDYVDEILDGNSVAGLDEDTEAGGEDAESDPLYDQAVDVVTRSRKASISYVQRRLRVGYNRSARLVEQMEASGVVGPSDGGTREVLASPPPDAD
ncbi:DNA translocase FtsK [Salinisphaera orenii]|uniref:DNA translocase FtsK n=1 Tax=Salinisphaera orenii TaxID=856731 RepID=UPI000DBE1233